MLPLIEVRALSKRFYKNKKEDIHAIRHVSFNIEKGDIVGIIGRSGAGKSTLIRCLAGLENPTFGQILFNGNDIAEMGAESVRNYRKQIGMIFQQFNLLNGRTAAQNISYPLEIHHVPKEESNRRVAELIALVGLQEQKDAYPAQLSGGQKQRVGIARALAYEPEILYCDEATSALDPNTSREILHLLKSIHKKLGITIVLITHEMEVIKQICNKVVVLEKGEVVEIGTISQLFSNPKHPVTKSLVLKTIHEIPAHFFQSTDPGCKLVHLHFRGEKADQPIITQMIKRFHIEANILLGWIDSLQSITVGNLILQLIGQPESVQHAMQFLKEQGIYVEVLEKQ